MTAYLKSGLSRAGMFVNVTLSAVHAASAISRDGTQRVDSASPDRKYSAGVDSRKIRAKAEQHEIHFSQYAEKA